MNEEKLLNHLKRRKRGSIERAIDLYTPYVSVIVYNIIGGIMTKEDVEEVVADTFVSLWKSVQTLDSTKGCIRSYLGSLARNCAKKKLRDVKICNELDENLVYVNGEPGAHIEKMGGEADAAGADKKSLASPDSEIFLRPYWYNEKYQEFLQLQEFADRQ